MYSGDSAGQVFKWHGIDKADVVIDYYDSSIGHAGVVCYSFVHDA